MHQPVRNNARRTPGAASAGRRPIVRQRALAMDAQLLVLVRGHHSGDAVVAVLLAVLGDRQGIGGRASH